MERSLDKWLADAPRLDCDWEPLGPIYKRSLVDLAALRFSPPVAGGQSLPAAGLPWFMTMFGRDSIFTSLQSLPFAPELAATTLRVLGDWQGSRHDDFRDEDPGRILHEMRYGEMAAFEERPHSPYYGSVDATPLWVVLLDEYERWTGDRKLVRDLEYEARAALNWIDEYADLMGNGYISYKRRNEQTGLENQAWKDSWNSISYSDGRLPDFPRATCELQGYAYDAKVRGARLARLVWKDPAFAERLEAEAADLKRRFNRDFWIPEREYFALALDADGTQVDSLASNIGHLLWSGIVDASKAKAVVDHLMGPRLYSGWGIRTLAEGEARYNPIGYHLGTVWPFDNSFIAWGLRNYGYKEEAARVASGILDAAVVFEGRLPEAFGGYERVGDEVPGPLPHRLQPAGVVDRRAAAPAADDARARARRRPPRGRPGAPRGDRPSRAARHPRPLGPAGRVRSRAGQRRSMAWQRQRRTRAPEDDTMTNDSPTTRVVIVGGGFAGVACARELAKHDDVHVTLIDKNDYHQFQPLLYQVAASMLVPRDIAYPLRKIAAEFKDFEAKRGEVVAIDPAARTATTDTGETYGGDYLVLAAGSQPSFFGTPGRRARVPALLAGRRGAARHPDHPGVRGGGPRRRRSSTRGRSTSSSSAVARPASRWRARCPR